MANQVSSHNTFRLPCTVTRTFVVPFPTLQYRPRINGCWGTRGSLWSIVHHEPC